MSALHISDTLTLPLDSVTMTQVTLGRKGSGKTNTAVVAVEEMLTAGQQIVVLDPVGVWWGLKSNRTGDGPGFPIPILGGDHGDVPLEAAAGEVIARAIVEQHFSCVIDIGLFSKGQMLRFAADFLETLYRLNRDSMHLVVDEADAFAPQRTFGEDARTLGAMQSVVRRGRARGIGVTMITQRPQVLNKDVLTQADILCALRLSHPKDIGAVKEWVDVHAEPKEAREMVESLPDLPTGTAWFWAPTLRLFQRVKVRARNTFDSSATPKPGERRVEPQNLAHVDIQKLGTQIAATVKDQEANSPAVLKRRIAELEKSQSNPGREKMLVEQIQQMERELNESRSKLAAYAKADGILASLADELKEMAGKASELASVIEGVRSKVDTPPAAAPKANGAYLDVKSLSSVPVGVSIQGVNVPQQKILDAIATFEAAGVPARPQHIAGFCGTTRRARGWEENIRTLKAAGMITTDNGVLRMTGNYGVSKHIASGLDALRAVLSEPQMRMLGLIREKPGINVESLAERLMTTARARGFEENLRRLRSDELVVGSKDSLRVAEWLR